MSGARFTKTNKTSLPLHNNEMFTCIYSTNNVIFIFLFEREIEMGMSNEHEHCKMSSIGVLMITDWRH